ncbi:hypothetical protein [Chitinophaga caseinilytica]|uniref:Uncharacterized protein n=1 Tax=Chitinophaga caseinilytica TaxID=2267521 RepID=A0ABZ2Z4K1_9BACT
MKIAFIILTCFTSCAVIKQTDKVRFEYYSGTQRQKVVLSIPKGATLVKITAGGEGEEHRYWYADSSVIYISNLTGSATLNALLINREQSDYNRRFMSDTASFTGTDEKGNYWKEVKNGNLLYGYSNVPINKKEIFNYAITSLR